MRMSELLNEVRSFTIDERVTSTSFRKKTARVNPMTQKDIERMVKDRKYKGNTSALMKDVKKKFPDEYESDIVQDMMRKHAETNEQKLDEAKYEVNFSKGGKLYSVSINAKDEDDAEEKVIKKHKIDSDDIRTVAKEGFASDAQRRAAFASGYKEKDKKKKEEVNEDGHTDVASAVRQCKTMVEDATQIMSKLQTMSPEESLPSWWTNKLAIASNSMNKLRDYFLVPTTEEVEFDEKAGDIPDLKNLVGELVKASGMHLAQSKRVQAHVDMMDKANAKGPEGAGGLADLKKIVGELEKASEAHKRQSKSIEAHVKFMGEELDEATYRVEVDGGGVETVNARTPNEAEAKALRKMGLRGTKGKTYGPKVKVQKIKEETLDEAMYHHVLKNKVVASGSKSDMMKLVKKTGATVRKGPDTNYVLNSPSAKVGDIKEINEKFTKKDFRDNEDINAHTENGVEIVNMFGTPAEKKLMAQIAKNHQKNRGISEKEQKLRDAMVKKYYPKLESVSEETELAEAFKPDQVKAAIAIARDNRFSMKGMVDKKTAIEKIAKGLSKDPAVKKVLDKMYEEFKLGEGNLNKKQMMAAIKKDVKSGLGKIAHRVVDTGSRFEVYVDQNDEADAQRAMKNHILYISGKLRVIPESVELDEAKSQGMFIVLEKGSKNKVIGQFKDKKKALELKNKNAGAKVIQIGKFATDNDKPVDIKVGDELDYMRVKLSTKIKEENNLISLASKHISHMQMAEKIDPADVDDDASEKDIENAAKNIIMQLRKSVSMRGNKDVEFASGKQKVDMRIAQKAISMHMKMKPQDKLKFQNTIAKSYKDLLNAVKGK